MTSLDFIRDAVKNARLAFRGAFHPETSDQVPLLPGGAVAQTVVLVGMTGVVGWAAFAASEEARDTLPDPLDRWSVRVVGDLAKNGGGTPLYPFAGPPWHPFQHWAQKAEPVYPSPLGMLIHPEWGLWHSYRGAIALAERLPLPPRTWRSRPCDTCAGRPCLEACPVGAFRVDGFRAASCIGYLDGVAGTKCMTQGCAARLACPVGEKHQQGPEQIAFHMRAFKAARRSV